MVGGVRGGVTRHRSTTHPFIAVDLLEDLFEVRLTLDAAERAVGQPGLLVEFVVPGEVQERLIAGLGRAGIQVLEALAPMFEKSPFTHLVLAILPHQLDLFAHEILPTLRRWGRKPVNER